jgi:tRNA (cytidine/uridine-2'-O-)-methyltransferase
LNRTVTTAENALRLALYEPDIAPNAGAMMRLGACLGVAIDLIEPCGFVLSDRRLRRAAMDYIEAAALTRHRSWPAFLSARPAARLVLLTTRAETPYADFRFRRDDVIVVGRETAGVPDHVHEAAHARLCVPMAPGMRSLNVALAAAMVLGEALRQTGGFQEGAR